MNNPATVAAIGGALIGIIIWQVWSRCKLAKRYKRIATEKNDLQGVNGDLRIEIAKNRVDIDVLKEQVDMLKGQMGQSQGWFSDIVHGRKTVDKKAVEDFLKKHTPKDE